MLTEARQGAEAMRGDLQLPRENGELVFEAPWQGRAFGMAIVLVDQLGLPWSEFQRRLIAALADDPDRPYYRSWALALEDLVLAQGLVTADEVAAAEALELLPDH